MGDHVFLKVMPKRGVVKFDKRGKLSSRYIGPFEILERVSTVAYQLCIMDSQEQVLQGKTVRLVKVLWQHRGVEEATWEREDTMHV